MKVETKIFSFEDGIDLENGTKLSSFELIVEMPVFDPGGSLLFVWLIFPKPIFERIFLNKFLFASLSSIK